MRYNNLTFLLSCCVSRSFTDFNFWRLESGLYYKPKNSIIIFASISSFRYVERGGISYKNVNAFSPSRMIMNAAVAFLKKHRRKYFV